MTSTEISDPTITGPRIPNNYTTPQKNTYNSRFSSNFYPSYLPSPNYKPIKFGKESDIPVREIDKSKDVNIALKDLALQIIEYTIAIFFALSSPELFCASLTVGFLAKRLISSTANKIQNKLYPLIKKYHFAIPVIAIYNASVIHAAIYFKINTYAINRLGAIVFGIRCGKLIADNMPREYRKMAELINSITGMMMKKFKSLKSRKVKTVEIKAPTVTK